MHVKSDSDVTSLASSSPSRSPPKRPPMAIYYVQSPSRDSHDGDKSSSAHATPVFNSPMESPSHPSFRHSSASRFSGTLGGRGRRRPNEKGWPECNVILEEGNYDDVDGGGAGPGFLRSCQALIALFLFIIVFTTFCLIIWGAARPSKPEVVVKSLVLDDFYSGEGTDATGVPTKMVTLNCSLKINVYNPASMFGIHVTSSQINVKFLQISIATGQLQKYYQPRKSHQTVSAILRGDKVPLYGAGAGMPLTSSGGAIPLTMEFDILSRGYVVGRLVKVKHRRSISCSFVVDSKSIKLKFTDNSCVYE